MEARDQHPQAYQLGETQVRLCGLDATRQNDWLAEADEVYGYLVVAHGEGRLTGSLREIINAVRAVIVSGNRQPARVRPAAVDGSIALLKHLHNYWRAGTDRNASRGGVAVLIALLREARLYIVHAGGAVRLMRLSRGRSSETVAGPLGDARHALLGGDDVVRIEVATEPLRARDVIVALPADPTPPGSEAALLAHLTQWHVEALGDPDGAATRTAAFPMESLPEAFASLSSVPYDAHVTVTKDETDSGSDQDAWSALVHNARSLGGYGKASPAPSERAEENKAELEVPAPSQREDDHGSCRERMNSFQKYKIRDADQVISNERSAARWASRDDDETPAPAATSGGKHGWVQEEGDDEAPPSDALAELDEGFDLGQSPRIETPEPAPGLQFAQPQGPEEEPARHRNLESSESLQIRERQPEVDAFDASLELNRPVEVDEPRAVDETFELEPPPDLDAGSEGAEPLSLDGTPWETGAAHGTPAIGDRGLDERPTDLDGPPAPHPPLDRDEGVEEDAPWPRTETTELDDAHGFSSNERFDSDAADGDELSDDLQERQELEEARAAEEPLEQPQAAVADDEAGMPAPPADGESPGLREALGIDDETPPRWAFEEDDAFDHEPLELDADASTTAPSVPRWQLPSHDHDDADQDASPSGWDDGERNVPTADDPLTALLQSRPEHDPNAPADHGLPTTDGLDEEASAADAFRAGIAIGTRDAADDGADDDAVLSGGDDTIAARSGAAPPHPWVARRRLAKNNSGRRTARVALATVGISAVIVGAVGMLAATGGLDTLIKKQLETRLARRAAVSPDLLDPVPYAFQSLPKGAQLIVDGSPTGRYTPIDDYQLEPGKRHIELRYGSFGSWSDEIEVEPKSKGNALVVSLTGTLSARTDKLVPGVTIEIDGQPIGNAPVVLDSIPAGVHVVRFAGPEGYTWEEEVAVHVDDVTEVIAPMSGAETLALVTVRSARAGATGILHENGRKVLVDGAEHGVTPAEIYLTPGRHAIEVESSGYGAVRRIIEVRPGERRYVDLQIDRPAGIRIEHDPPAAVTAGASALISAELRGHGSERRHQVYLHLEIEGVWKQIEMGAVPGAPEAYVAGLPVTSNHSGERARYYFTAEDSVGETFYTPIYTVPLK